MSALKNAKTNYVIVGAFVLSCLIGVIATVVILTGRTGAVDTYYTVYDRVQGLKFGTKVVYEGYPVGQIEEITPQRQDGRMRFLVELSVQEGWTVPNDSVAAVASSGLLRAPSIDIRAGVSPVALKSGARIQGAENANMFAAMSTLAQQVSSLLDDEIRPLLLTLNTAATQAAILLGEDAGALAGSLKAILADIQAQSPQIVDNLSVFSSDMRQTGHEVSQVFSAQNRAKIDKMLTDLQKIGSTMERADHLMGNVDDLVTDNKPELEKAIADLQFVMETMARHVDTVAQNMEGTSRNMFEFSRQIRKNPGVLIGGTTSEETAE